MAAMKVEVTLKDMIKPSRPTPNHLKIRQFSFLDQLAMPLHMPTILYYQNHSLVSTSSTSLLKSSLSETLVHFYPLAGRIDYGDEFIDCNDEGVEFYEARVSTNLSAILQDPNPDELTKLLAFSPVSNNRVTVAGVQVNRFTCGGVAISTSISHKIADAATVTMFLNAWATTAGGGAVVVQLGEFVPSSLFPPRDMGNENSGSVLGENDMTTTRRVIFDKEHLNALKNQVVHVEGMKSPSTSLLVCAYIWKLFVEVARAKTHPPKVFGARQAMSLRKLLSSSVEENCLGNMFAYSTVASYYLGDHNSNNDLSDNVYGDMIAKLYESTKKVDVNYLKRVQNGEINPRALPREYYNDHNIGDVELCNFSSCIWFPFYKVDFGWGEPVWVSSASIPYRNVVQLLPTKCGHGIEVWLFLHQDYVSILDLLESSLSKRAFMTKAILSHL